MNKINELDVLIENLKELGFKPNVAVEDKSTLMPSPNRFASSTTVKVSLSDSLFFLARANVSSSFTGLFSTIDLPNKVEYKVYRRSWFDFLLLPKRQKVGVKYIDENLTIISQEWIPSKELNFDSAKLLIDLNSTGKPYKLIIENNYLYSLIEELYNKKVIVVEVDDWLYEKDDLKNLFKLEAELISTISMTKNNNKYD
jgi:hypothetical protein